MAEWVDIIPRKIKDEVVIWDNSYVMEQLSDGTVRLTPDIDGSNVISAGTPINKELLQLMENRIAELMNEVFGRIGDVVVKTYIPREIKDRVAIGDDKYIIEQLEDGRVRLIPSPDLVTEPGTDINRALLQPMEDQIAMLMNRVFGKLTENPFVMTFTSLSEVNVSGIWNESTGRIEC
jgi:hypothetical protein